jgi:hypothetical protein
MKYVVGLRAAHNSTVRRFVLDARDQRKRDAAQERLGPWRQTATTIA